MAETGAGCKVVGRWRRESLLGICCEQERWSFGGEDFIFFLFGGEDVCGGFDGWSFVSADHDFIVTAEIGAQDCLSRWMAVDVIGVPSNEESLGVVIEATERFRLAIASLFVSVDCGTRQAELFGGDVSGDAFVEKFVNGLADFGAVADAAGCYPASHLFFPFAWLDETCDWRGRNQRADERGRRGESVVSHGAFDAGRGFHDEGKIELASVAMFLICHRNHKIGRTAWAEYFVFAHAPDDSTARKPGRYKRDL
jgi:hypothetical protein